MGDVKISKEKLLQELATVGFDNTEIEKIKNNSQCYLANDKKYLDVCVSCCKFPQCISLNFCERFCERQPNCDNYALYTDILKVLNMEY